MTEIDEVVDIKREKLPPPDKKQEARLRPLNDMIVCRRLEGYETEKGGIIIPDFAQEKSQDAVVVAVGPGKLTPEGKRIPVYVKVGQRVILPQYGADVNAVKLGMHTYPCLREDSIITIVLSDEEVEMEG